MSVLEQETDLLSSVDLSKTISFLNSGEQAADGNREKFVAFYLGKSIYCISAKAVLEVVHPLPVTPLPNTPASISGIAAFRGEVVAVINIKRLLELDESNANGKAKLVILRSNAKDTQFAIPVDSMHELISISPDAVIAGPNAASDGMICSVEHEGGFLKLIETDILFARLEQSIG